MGCPKLKKFLCCVSLETGGLIMGWVTLVASVLLVAYASTLLALVITLYNNSNQGPNESTLFAITVVVLSILLVYWFLVFFAAGLLIYGTKKRDYTKLMPYMIFMILGAIVALLQLAAADLAYFLFSLFLACAEIYFFFCVYSLYSKFKVEKLGNTQQTVPPMIIVYGANQPQHQYPVSLQQHQSNPYQQQPQVVLYQSSLEPSAPPLSPQPENSDPQKTNVNAYNEK